MQHRIKEIRKSQKLTQAEFGKKLGVKANTITSYETGVRVPTSAVITLICREFNVSEDWLRTGDGKMFNPTPETDDVLIDRIVRECTDGSPVFHALAKTYLNLDSDHRKAFDDYVIEFLQNYNEEKAKRKRAETLALAQRQIDVEAKDTRASEPI